MVGIALFEGNIEKKLRSFVSHFEINNNLALHLTTWNINRLCWKPSSDGQIRDSSGPDIANPWSKAHNLSEYLLICLIICHYHSCFKLAFIFRGIRTFLPTQRMGFTSGEAWAEIFRFRSDGYRRTTTLLRMSVLQWGCAQGPGKTIKNH